MHAAMLELISTPVWMKDGIEEMMCCLDVYCNNKALLTSNSILLRWQNFRVEVLN